MTIKYIFNEYLKSKQLYLEITFLFCTHIVKTKYNIEILFESVFESEKRRREQENSEHKYTGLWYLNIKK